MKRTLGIHSTKTCLQAVLPRDGSINGKKQNVAGLPGIVSSLMTWDTIESWNVGIDWGLSDNRLTGSFDYYNRYTYDMIGPAPTLPSVLGASAPQINNCDMKSYGWELELSWRDRIQQFNYGCPPRHV